MCGQKSYIVEQLVPEWTGFGGVVVSGKNWYLASV